MLILRPGVENFGVIHIPTLKDLYFFKSELHQDFKEVRANLMPLLMEREEGEKE